MHIGAIAFSIDRYLLPRPRYPSPSTPYGCCGFCAALFHVSTRHYGNRQQCGGDCVNLWLLCNGRLGIRNTTAVGVAVGLLGFLTTALLARPVSDSAAVGVAVRLVRFQVTVILYVVFSFVPRNNKSQM